MKTMLLLFRILFLFFFFVLSKNSWAQNTGIGISNATKGKLEVYGVVGYTSAIFGSDGAGVSLERNWPTIGFNQYNNGQASQANSLAQTQTRRLTIWQNGNVSLLNTNANASLFVGPSAAGITACRLRGTTYHSTFAERVTGQTTQHTIINAGKNGSSIFINDQGLGN